VPSDPDTPRGPRVLSKNRMEGFSDGVFGFAMTLLVADLALHPPGTPLQQVLHAWPAYLAYLTSFLTIGGAWLAHNWDPSWMRMRGTSTSTHRRERARSCRAHSENFCPPSSGM